MCACVPVYSSVSVELNVFICYYLYDKRLSECCFTERTQTQVMMASNSVSI